MSLPRGEITASPCAAAGGRYGPKAIPTAVAGPAWAPPWAPPKARGPARLRILRSLPSSPWRRRGGPPGQGPIQGATIATTPVTVRMLTAVDIRIAAETRCGATP